MERQWFNSHEIVVLAYIYYANFNKNVDRAFDLGSQLSFKSQ